MSKRWVLRYVGLVVAAALIATPALATGEKTNKAPERRGLVITEVRGNSITVTIGYLTDTVSVKQHTEVLLNGHKARVTDLRPGMLVTSIAIGTDRTFVSRISVTSARSR